MATKLAVPKHVRETVVQPMTALKSPPFGCSDVNLALNQYGAMLAPFSQKALAKAWEGVCGEWDKPEWPPIPMLLKEARRWANDNHQPMGESMAGYVKRRSALIEKNWYLAHPKVTETAKQEAWWFDLSHAIRERASAIAVQEHRTKPDISPELVITQADIAKFRQRVESRNRQFERIAKGEDHHALLKVGDILKRNGLAP